MTRELTSSQKELLHADPNEKNRRFVQDAIELVLSFGDFQKQIDSACSPQVILSEASSRIEHLIHFDASALYLVDEETSDLVSFKYRPETSKDKIDQEMEFLIDNDYLAWAMRERRGVTVYSKDGSHQVLLHALATYARIRGLFIGCFPVEMKGLPDTAMEILSLILRNTANVLESICCMNTLKHQNSDLERKVAEKTQSLVRFERQLMQAQKMESIAALAGGVAHQYNNALAGLVGYIDLLALIGQRTVEIDRFLNGVRPITEKMTNLTHQLLTYAHGGHFNPQVVRLQELLNNAMPGLRRSVKSAIRIQTDMHDPEVKIMADMMQLQMALTAIISNADEAVDEQGTISIRTQKISFNDESALPCQELVGGEYAYLSIQDSGKGMDSHTISRLFEPFFTTKFEGRGLSMAAVQGIIQKHQGVIHVDSQPGQGTLVEVYIPVHQ